MGADDRSRSPPRHPAEVTGSDLAPAGNAQRREENGGGGASSALLDALPTDQLTEAAETLLQTVLSNPVTGALKSGASAVTDKVREHSA